jgi:hypothetical protein
MHSAHGGCRAFFSTGVGGFRTRRPIPAFACAFIVLGSLSVGQAAEREPLQGVSIEAKDLTAAEMSEVRRFAREAGKAPWLIYGFRYGLGAKSTPRRTQIAIYLEPDVENGRLRRGRILQAEISAPAGEARQASPRIPPTLQYAHVVVLGRRPNEVNGKWDVHRPFVVDGEFADETLFAIVALIRRSPEGPPLPNGEPGAKIDGSLAISRVRRTDNGVEVTLNRDDYHGAYVTLEERNGRFVIIKHDIWIV